MLFDAFQRYEQSETRVLINFSSFKQNDKSTTSSSGHTASTFMFSKNFIWENFANYTLNSLWRIKANRLRFVKLKIEYGQPDGYDSWAGTVGSTYMLV